MGPGLADVRTTNRRRVSRPGVISSMRKTSDIGAQKAQDDFMADQEAVNLAADWADISQGLRKDLGHQLLTGKKCERRGFNTNKKFEYNITRRQKKGKSKRKRIIG